MKLSPIDTTAVGPEPRAALADGTPAPMLASKTAVRTAPARLDASRLDLVSLENSMSPRLPPSVRHLAASPCPLWIGVS
jgi:hypothetical protein